MMNVNVTLNKSATITVDYGNKHEVFSTKNTNETIAAIRQLLNADSIKIVWQVYHGAPVSIDKQNATMMRRAKKIVAALGRDVSEFSQINGVSYGFTL